MGCIHIQSTFDSKIYDIFPKTIEYDIRSQDVVSVHLPTKLQMPTDRPPTYIPGQQFTSKNNFGIEQYEHVNVNKLKQQRKQEQTTNNEQIKKKSVQM